jgi:lysophospholipase L1-like esterase
VIVLYAGDNDLNAGKTPEEVADDFRAFVSKVRSKLPETRILYIAIKPSIKRWSIVDKGRETNRRIAEAIEALGDSRVELVDLGGSMLGSDGKPRAELFVADGLHLSDAGYRLWAEALRPQLVE